MEALKMSQPQRVVFETNTILDVRAITTFGINAKPNTNSPIGFFGTGLKYAISVLLANKLDVVIYIGRREYHFEKETDSFRGTDFEFIRMVRKWNGTTLPSLGRYQRMPFTTELGKTWKLWMAFRELYSNTLDENGSVRIIEGPVSPASKVTKIVVTGQSFIDCFHNREEYFLPGGLRERPSTDKNIQVFEARSKWLYYRGMAVKEMKPPSELTYNILEHIELTEDRTAKYDWEIQEIISRYIATQAPKHHVKAVLQSEGYEKYVPYTFVHQPPSKQFDEVLDEGTEDSISWGARDYHKRMHERDTTLEDERPFRYEAPYIVNNTGSAVLVLIQEDEKFAKAVVKALNNYEA